MTVMGGVMDGAIGGAWKEGHGINTDPFSIERTHTHRRGEQRNREGRTSARYSSRPLRGSGEAMRVSTACRCC